MKKIAFLLVLLFALNNTVLTVGAADALSGTAVSIVHDGETRIVSLENGYTAEVSFTVEPMAEEALRASATTRSKFTSTMKIKNSLGMTIQTLNAVGVFDTNGVVTIPVDAYGSGSSGNVSNPSNSLGPRGYSSWVKVRLTGSVPGHVATFDYTCTITCDANKNSTAAWE